MRNLGVDLDTFSIREPSAAELEDPLIRTEVLTTYAVLNRPRSELIAAHLRFLISRPTAYWRTFVLALRHRAPGLKGLALSLAHFAEAVLLARELKRRDITQLHNHFANSAATVGFLATRLLRLPWSFTIHGISETDYPAGLLLGRKIEAADFVACVSYFGRAQAMRLVEPRHWSKLHVVRCALRFDELPSHAPASKNSVRIVCVGRLSPEKGQAGLLQAFSTAAAEIEDLRLVFVGSGPIESELRTITDSLDLNERVTFAGRLGEIDTMNEIARSDILVLPSFMEGLPVVLMEAMAVGTAVIASRVAGIPELVEDGKSGLLFTPSNWQELSGRIRDLARDRELRARLAATGRERVAVEFESSRSAMRMLQLFRNENPS